MLTLFDIIIIIIIKMVVITLCCSVYCSNVVAFISVRGNNGSIVLSILAKFYDMMLLCRASAVRLSLAIVTPLTAALSTCA